MDIFWENQTKHEWKLENKNKKELKFSRQLLRPILIPVVIHDSGSVYFILIKNSQAVLSVWFPKMSYL